MKRLVLLGPGLANLQVLDRLGARADVTLVSEGRQHTYSGMLPGVLAHQHAAADASIDLDALCQRSSAQLEPAGAARVLLGERQVELRDGRRIPFDFVSINVGAGVRGVELPGIREHATLIKPLASGLERLLDAAAPFVVAGGGVAAVELSLVLRRRTGGPTTLVSSAETLPRSLPAFVSAAAHELARAGVTVISRRRIVGADPHLARLDDGSSLPFATLVWATGARAPALLAESGAAVDDKGYLCVSPTLESTSHPNVFGAGDCVSIRGHEGLEKAGVFSIRQGPTLVQNLADALAGRAPSARYEPRLNPLQLLNLGDGRALGTWKGKVFSGRAAYWLKEAIDRRWIRHYPTGAAT